MIKPQYNVLSPDGFSIHHSDTYSSKKKAFAAFREWKQRYKSQGYYSSAKYGRIHLRDLSKYCQLVTV